MYASSYPTMNNAAPDPRQEQKQQQYSYNNNPQSSPPNETSLVPAVAPGYNVYGNYHVPVSPSSSNVNTSSSNNDTLDDLMSFDVPPPPTFQSLNEARAFPQQQQQQQQHVDSRGLQDRDDAFVSNLPSEIVREQQRILDEIQKNNQNNNNRNSNAISSSSNSNYLTAQQQQLVAYSHNDYSITSSRNDGPLPAEVHPAKYQMKTERKVKTAAAATTGAIVGGLITGPAWPIGAAAGAAVGGYACKVTARAGERKQQRQWERRNVNSYASRGVAGVQGDDVVFT